VVLRAIPQSARGGLAKTKGGERRHDCFLTKKGREKGGHALSRKGEVLGGRKQDSGGRLKCSEGRQKVSGTPKTMALQDISKANGGVDGRNCVKMGWERGTEGRPQWLKERQNSRRPLKGKKKKSGPEGGDKLSPSNPFCSSRFKTGVIGWERRGRCVGTGKSEGGR